ncbi:hypothetical protein SAMN05216486_10847 [bacterium JGI 053]|nr:hypothetical protein SAMN05216486_10847 [bacterium JGI 053]
MHYKDAVLDDLAASANVAQFVSFAPDGTQRFARLNGYAQNSVFSSVYSAVEVLLAVSAEHSVNIRSFEPSNPKSREFVYGIRNVEEAVAHVARLGSTGLHTIVNETIDVLDGGVSGVAMGSVLEFAPGDTPRCVEKPGTVSVDKRTGLALLRVVYGFELSLPESGTHRVEFSIHPIRRGVRNEHTIIWEIEEVGSIEVVPELHWPNLFSRHVGDKAFGLLVAHLLGASVPMTTVVSRKVAPFSFGDPTGTSETWLRTAPDSQVPGKFTTTRGWQDPFALLQAEDADGGNIASVLSQEGVDARFSGAAIASRNDERSVNLLIEGVRGFGDPFMSGRQAPERLPRELKSRIAVVYRQLASRLGAVRFEWAADDDRIWILQLHLGATPSSQQIIYPGSPRRYRAFDVARGLESLRELVTEVRGTGEGIVLRGRVGITSHFGDVLRRAQIPSKMDGPLTWSPEEEQIELDGAVVVDSMFAKG